MSRIVKVAAVILIVVGIGAGIMWFAEGTTSVAWADVQESVRNIRTLTCMFSMHPKGGPEMAGKMMVMEPGLMRHEMTKPMKGVTIIDLQKGKMITLMPQQKKVMSAQMEPSSDAMKEFLDRFVIAHLKKMIEQSQTELGRKQINGRTAQGYRVEDVDKTVSIWVDAETCALLEVELTVFRGEMKIVMTDFEFDRQMDKNLFSLDVPPGYTEIAPGLVLREPAFKDVAVLLRVMAKMKDGAFPDALPANPTMASYKKHLQGFNRVLGGEEARKVVLDMGRGIMFLAKIQPAGHYAGKGVKLGDADTAIFWYKPEGSETYKVIYGDLSIKELAEENLPR